MFDVRYFNEHGRYDRISLPKTKKELYDKMGKNCYEQGLYDIYNVCILGEELESFECFQKLESYNLLAEKMEKLSRDDLGKLQAILLSKNMFITSKLEEFDPLKLCVFIDNMDKYNLHKSKEHLTDEQLNSCERISTTGFIGYLEHPKQKIEFVDYSEVYQKYKMPEDASIVTIYLEEFIDVGKYSEELIEIEMPLRDIIKDDLQKVLELDKNRNFRIEEAYGHKIDFYMKYLVNKEDLLELNEFLEEFIKQPVDIQRKFNNIYNMYNEIYGEVEYENGIPINEFEQVMRDIDKFEYLNDKEMRTAVVNSYLREKGVDKEFRAFLDYDSLYEKVYEENDIYEKNIYKGTYNTYVVNKHFYNEHLKEESEVEQNAKEYLAEKQQEEENNFEMGM